ncbi:MAG: DoxX family protein [Gemmatimonadetes bacterium]|nr:DoxX family protein [Gemmatimonadota bacterium]NNF38283.1 DoxX family protein [Gemmatimonadota bacterium]NNK63748.1 DoxX family protein [Gemmatimonadota bacterium]
MVAAGVAHFVNPDFYLRIMPPWLPWHEALILLSGVCEVAAGVLVLTPRTRRAGGLFAIAVLLGVFPANVWMAIDPSIWPEIPVWGRWARLPLQALLIVWAWRVTQPRGRSS